jgi:hypothetical protein
MEVINVELYGKDKATDVPTKMAKEEKTTDV